VRPWLVVVNAWMAPLKVQGTSKPGRRATWVAVSFRLDDTPGWKRKVARHRLAETWQKQRCMADIKQDCIPGLCQVEVAGAWDRMRACLLM